MKTRGAKKKKINFEILEVVKILQKNFRHLKNSINKPKVTKNTIVLDNKNLKNNKINNFCHVLEKFIIFKSEDFQE